MWGFWLAEKQDLQGIIKKHGYFEFRCELLQYFSPALFKISGVDLIPLMHAIWKKIPLLAGETAGKLWGCCLAQPKGR